MDVRLDITSSKRIIMSRQFVAILGICIAVWTIQNASFAQATAPHMMQTDEAEIRNNRVVLNDALRTRDVKAFENLWLEDVNITGYSGGLLVGREQIVAVFSKYLSSPNFVSGLRTPEKIEVTTGGPLEAAESGVFEWKSRKPDSTVIARGRYLIMWKKVEGRWKIRSELYVRTSELDVFK
jgi:ketosteroid isomerase-like protein